MVIHHLADCLCGYPEKLIPLFITPLRPHSSSAHQLTSQHALAQQPRTGQTSPAAKAFPLPKSPCSVAQTNLAAVGADVTKSMDGVENARYEEAPAHPCSLADLSSDVQSTQTESLQICSFTTSRLQKSTAEGGRPFNAIEPHISRAINWTLSGNVEFWELDFERWRLEQSTTLSATRMATMATMATMIELATFAYEAFASLWGGHQQLYGTR